MFFEILHLSDLHFGNPNAHLCSNDLRKALDSLLSKIEAPASFLVISGDVTFQGKKDGYKEAADIINAAIVNRGLDRNQVLVCPGNHDIVQEIAGQRYFTSFDDQLCFLKSFTYQTFILEILMRICARMTYVKH